MCEPRRTESLPGALPDGGFLAEILRTMLVIPEYSLRTSWLMIENLRTSAVGLVQFGHQSYKRTHM